MIRKNSNVTLKAYKSYKDHPEKDEPVGFGEDKLFGKHLKFTIMDVNNSTTEKPTTGFAYLNVYSNLPLKPNDMITVDEILYIQIKFVRGKNVVIFGVTIKQTQIGELGNEENILENVEVDF